MDWLERMNGAMDYIEAHLLDEIDYEQLAQKALCSNHHFQKMFSFITDVSLSEYIRRRRLTLAAFELQNSDIKIIDLALKYGYDSPVSFARAFQNCHGIVPSHAKDKGIQLKAYPRMSFQLTLKGEIEMNYRIEEKSAFKVHGVDFVVKNTNEENFTSIPEFWDKNYENGTVKRLKQIELKNPIKNLCNVNAIMCYEMLENDTFPYMIGLIDFDGTSSVPSDLKTVNVSAFTWAIFRTENHKPSETVEKIQAIWKRIFPEWFPNSGYEHAEGPDMELYYMLDDKLGYSEVWIPVVKR